MKKQTIQLICISIGFIVVYFIVFKRMIEGFNSEENPVIKAIRTVDDNYRTLQRELINSNTIGNQYKSIPITVILEKTKADLNKLENDYRAHTVTYSDVRESLKPYIKILNEIIQKDNVNMRNLRIEVVMPDLQNEQLSNQYTIYKSKDEYSA